MSYQVLARRWRPQTFDQVVGQEHVLRALVNALGSGRVHHAYLLTGTRGVGKTTLARLIAKCLNCERGVSATPCGECGACTEIAAGRFVDLIEVDAASRTKVEDTRDILDNVQYMPTRGRYKVYLIDEVHMLSTSSFNALLKTLEEPPEHVKFLLATTDPQKLPATVLSRCLQFHLKNLAPEQIAHHLGNVLRAESIDFEEPALLELGQAADGSMRDALSLTDQAIAHGGGAVRVDAVQEMLGQVQRELLLALLDGLFAGDAAAVLAAVAALAEQGTDFERALVDMLALVHRVALVQSVPALLDKLHGERGAIERWSRAAAPADVQLYYQVGVVCRRDMPYAPDSRSGFEMALLRMLAFRPARADAATARAGAGEPVPAARGVADSPKKPDPAPAAATGSAPDSATPAAAVPRVEMAAPSSGPAPVAAPRAGPAGQSPAPAVTSPAAEPAPAPVTAQPDAPAADGATAADAEPAAPTRWEAISPANWHVLLRELDIDGMAGAVAHNSVPEGVEDGTLRLLVEDSQSVLCSSAVSERIAAALEARFGAPRQLAVRFGTPHEETPAQRARRLAEREQARACAAIEADPNVRLLLEEFAGTLHRESIRPQRAEEQRPGRTTTT